MNLSKVSAFKDQKKRVFQHKTELGLCKTHASKSQKTTKKTVSNEKHKKHETKKINSFKMVLVLIQMQMFFFRLL